MYKVGYQGKNGTYSEQACLKYFNKDDISTFNFKEFTSLVKAVETNEIDYALLPVENSTTGIIYRTYDLLKDHQVFAVGEQYVKIVEYLIGTKDASIDTIKEVYSHPEALNQCRHYLAKKNYHSIAYQDTASAVKYIKSQNDPSKAALASQLASDYYDMKIIEKDVQDNKLNTTRFIVVTNKPNYLQNANKISMYFVVNHQPGSLYSVLEFFAKNKINLLKLESRPLENILFEYCFYIDFEGNLNDEIIQKTLKHVADNCVEYKILGNYCRGNINE